MTIKTDVSRFHIHDELTAPEGSVKILKGVQGAAGEVSKFIGVLAGAPAALRAYARMRHELRGGLAAAGDPRADRARGGRAPRRPLLDRPARADRARRRPRARRDHAARGGFESADPKQAALLAFLEALLATDGRPAQHLGEEAREHDWTDEELLEAVAHLAMNEFQSLIANAAALPQDQSDSAVLPAAA